MEIGVHNGTLAIYVALEVLDSLTKDQQEQVAVPAAVYSIIMFVFAAVWGSYISRRLVRSGEAVPPPAVPAA